ncbi:MAG: hypothetical protein JXA78_05220 [Anaerolineales bacterium]|nr:hypothetical protein [Anaerolineales bacterium]
MNTFAFIIHPIEVKRDVMRKYPFWGRVFSERQIEFISMFFPPVYISEIDGIRSASTGEEIRGWFLACPLTPTGMLKLPKKFVYRKIIQTGRMAERLGAQILGLGAFTSVAGDAGVTVANELKIPVTTGDAYTASIAVQALCEAASVMDIQLGSATVAVVGATGAIGRVSAELLAQEAGELWLIGRRAAALEALRDDLSACAGAKLNTSCEMQALKQAHLILTATSALQAIVHTEHLQPGCVVCDVARPRNISARVAANRPDVLVIDGGMVEVPGNVNFNFDFGYPPGKAYACMAETMALALENRLEDYTLGKNISRQRVEEITEIAGRHGFRLSGFRSFDHEITQDYIENVRRLAKRRF